MNEPQTASKLARTKEITSGEKLLELTKSESKGSAKHDRKRNNPSGNRVQEKQATD